MPTSLGPAEILVILVLALIVLGPKRLPEAGRQVGRFISDVRHWSSSVQSEIRDAIDLEGEPQPPPPTVAPNVAPPPVAPVLPSPADLGASPAPAGSEGADRPVSSGEWGIGPADDPQSQLPSPSEAHPSASTAPRPTSSNLPAEWSTPSPHSEN